MVILYKLYFLSSNFSSRPNKRVFHPSTFPLSQLNTYKRKLNLFYSSTFLSSLNFLSSHFSTLSTKWTLREEKTVEDNWWNLSQDVDCWEIASNSNCDLKSQLGFLVEEGKFNLGFLCVEGKTIHLCRMKVYFLLKK